MTELAKTYLEKGGPPTIAHGDHTGHLVDAETVLGLTCGVYQFPGGRAACGPAIMLDETPEKGEANDNQS